MASDWVTTEYYVQMQRSIERAPSCFRR
jgi:hypothetical protein